MPGIFGSYLIDKDNSKPDLIVKMQKILMHSELYASDIYSDNNINIGIISVRENVHRSIFKDLTNNIIVCLGGQIYDFIGINNGFFNGSEKIEEKIIKLYFKYGCEFPTKLNGDFNIYLFDIKKNLLIIANDRFGFRHLYYYNDNDIFLFAPEMKAFLAYSDFDKSLDEQGLSDYFSFRFHLGERTFFKKVKLLPPASFVLINNNNFVIKSYWNPIYFPYNGIKNLPEIVERGYDLFCKSIERRTAGFNKIIIPLSGGLDSRLIVATAKHLGYKFNTVTIGIPGCSEYEIAQKVANTLGIQKPDLMIVKPDWIKNYAEQIAWLNESSYAGLGLTKLYGFSKEVGFDYDCFLNGIFGGHITFGSPYFNKKDLEANFTDEECISTVNIRLEGYRYDLYLEKFATENLKDIVFKYRKKSLHEQWQRTKDSNSVFAFRLDNFLLYNRIRRAMNIIDLNRFFYNDQLPFASYDLYEFYLNLSPELLLNHYLYKEIYKVKYPKLARITYQATGVDLFHQPSKFNQIKRNLREKFYWYTGRLGIPLYDRKRENNDDVDYRKEHATKFWARKILLSDSFISRNLFYRDGIIKLLNYQDNGGGVIDEISKMVMFELWARKFID